MHRRLEQGAAVLAVVLLTGACLASGQATWTEAPAPALPGPVTGPGASAVGSVATPAATGGSAAQVVPGDTAMPGMGTSASASTATAAYQLPAPDPSAAPYRLYDATAPAVLPGTDHTITLTVEEKDFTIATGYVVHA